MFSYAFANPKTKTIIKKKCGTFVYSKKSQENFVKYFKDIIARISIPFKSIIANNMELFLIGKVKNNDIAKFKIDRTDKKHNRKILKASSIWEIVI